MEPLEYDVRFENLIVLEYDVWISVVEANGILGNSFTYDKILLRDVGNSSDSAWHLEQLQRRGILFVSFTVISI
jgi:hypothetical protein